MQWFMTSGLNAYIATCCIRRLLLQPLTTIIHNDVRIFSYSCDFDSCYQWYDDSCSRRHKRHEYRVSLFALVKLANLTSRQEMKGRCLFNYTKLSFYLTVFLSASLTICVFVSIRLLRNIVVYRCMYCTWNKRQTSSLHISYHGITWVRKSGLIARVIYI